DRLADVVDVEVHPIRMLDQTFLIQERDDRASVGVRGNDDDLLIRRSFARRRQEMRQPIPCDDARADDEQDQRRDDEDERSQSSGSPAPASSKTSPPRVNFAIDALSERSPPSLDSTGSRAAFFQKSLRA